MMNIAKCEEIKNSSKFFQVLRMRRYRNNHAVDLKLTTFNRTCGTIRRIVGQLFIKETQLKFYKTMAAVSYGSED